MLKIFGLFPPKVHQQLASNLPIKDFTFYYLAQTQRVCMIIINYYPTYKYYDDPLMHLVVW